ncbi:MAG: VOC family protein [Actinomycetes bacterium]
MSDSQFPAPDGGSSLGSAQPMRLTGIHHATLICSDLERTTAFYRDMLGMALVEEGVNADDPAARHFWFSSDPHAGGGEPALRLTFLEYPGMEKATQGWGGVHHLAFAVDSAAEVEAWREYLQQREIPTTETFNRDRLRSVYFRDPDGQIIEIVAPGD